jgi:hypothetical protein
MRYLIKFSTTLIIVLLIGCSSISSKMGNKTFCHANDLSSRLPSCSWETLKGTGVKEAFDERMKNTVTKVLRHYKAPVKDGNKYTGEITFCTDREGVIDNIILTKPSGHTGMDDAFIRAVTKTVQVPIPSDKCLADKFYFARVRLNYDETDMAE